jgi:hypothetical protein
MMARAVSDHIGSLSSPSCPRLSDAAAAWLDEGFTVFGLLLSLLCASEPLQLLLLEPRSRDGIRSRTSSGGTLAIQTMKMC